MFFFRFYSWQKLKNLVFLLTGQTFLLILCQPIEHSVTDKTVKNACPSISNLQKKYVYCENKTDEFSNYHSSEEGL